MAWKRVWTHSAPTTSTATVFVSIQILLPITERHGPHKIIKSGLRHAATMRIVALLLLFCRLFSFIVISKHVAILCSRAKLTL